MDRPMIPQDLAQDLAERHEKEHLWERGMGRCCDICDKLDALKRSKNPAEVAIGYLISGRLVAVGVAIEPGTKVEAVKLIQLAYSQAYVERDKAVEDLGVAVNAFLYGDGSQRSIQELRIDLVNKYASVREFYPEWDK